jgi:hypothetical protein
VVEPDFEDIVFLVREQDIRDHLVARGRDADFRPPVGVEVLPRPLDVMAARLPGPRRTASARFRERAAHQHGAARLTAMPRPEVARSMR